RMTRRGGKSTTLMDEEILKKAIVEQAEQEPQDQAGLIIKAEEIHFNEILKLRLEYRNILIIDHLWEFTSLAKLDLNHNLIEKIEGLDRLINLTWLNLTFNSIEKIEGLESLRKLEVLNLSNNRISVIENMDTLEKITHFFIANNLIEKLDKVLYLRKFKNLFTVNLFGNPVSKEDDYKFFIAAYFPNLVCLDYRLLDEKTVSINSGVHTFVQCRDLEDNYNEKVRKIAVATLEDVAKDKLDKDMPDDVKMLFTDKDTVMDALTTGHDNHLLKINGRETQLVTRVNAWKVALIKGIQDKELKRNRMRISDIHRYVDHLWEQLEELQYHHL
uniref:Dynein regulatory complex subunit 3 n=1 Tax=Sander lucioperca TaxID=283035 RepID=A0A8C9ZMX4_SANLU